MKFTYTSDTLVNLKTGAIVLFVNETDKVSGNGLKLIDASSGGAVSTLIESGEFTGKIGQIAVLRNVVGLFTDSVILSGLGQKKGMNADSFRQSAGYLSRNKTFTSAKKAVLYFEKYEDNDFFKGAVEGCLLGAYKILDYKSGDDAVSKSKLTEITLATDNKRLLSRMEKAGTKGEVIAEGQNLVRTLASTPSNYLTPKMFVSQAEKFGKKYKFSVKALDEAAIKKEKMGSFLSVSKGSDEPPRFLILEHKGGVAKKAPIVLVGKGVTFDSGGISLKPGLNMHEMKADMTGAAVVLSSLVTAARLGVKQNIVGLIPLTENMPSGKATKPGDIVTARNGKTIEIINTDAEGRLILADALDYANKFKPQAVIDVATLTGATLFILGYSGAPIMGNNDKLIQNLKDASDGCAERVWHLPIWDDHRDQMKSPIADLVNSGGRVAGTICAGAFLEAFIGDYPWAHVDIAYVDSEPKGRAYIPKGSTGIGLRLFTEMLLNWKKV